MLWRHILTIRFENLKRERDFRSCRYDISQADISDNVENLIQIVGLNSSDDIISNFSKNDIKDSVELFVTLKSCPSFYEKLYKKAIYGPKFKIAMLASKIVKKARGDFKVDAQKIFAKISSVLGFQHIVFYHESNEINGSNMQKNMFYIKGKRDYDNN